MGVMIKGQYQVEDPGPRDHAGEQLGVAEHGGHGGEAAVRRAGDHYAPALGQSLLDQAQHCMVDIGVGDRELALGRPRADRRRTRWWLRVDDVAAASVPLYGSTDGGYRTLFSGLRARRRNHVDYARRLPCTKTEQRLCA